MGIHLIGTNANTSGNTLAVSAVTVPTGATMLWFIYELNTSVYTVGGLNDGFVNSYSNLTNTGVDNAYASYGIAAAVVCYNAVALSGGTVTYSKHVPGAKCAMTGIYIDNVGSAPLDVDAVTYGSSTSPSVTASSPSTSGDYVVGCSFSYGSFSSFTQDSANGTYATPPNSAQTGTGASDIQIYGGSFQASTQPASFKYNPALGTSAPWAAIIVSFTPTIAPASSSGQFFQFFG